MKRNSLRRVISSIMVMVLLCFFAPLSLAAKVTEPRVISFVAGNTFTLALKADGTLWFWGLLEDVFKKETPYKLADNVRSVSAGHNYLLYVKNDNTLYGLGANYRGQLGVPGTEVRNTPVRVMENVNFARCSYEFSVCITLNNELYTWGSNEFGQLGNGMKGNFYDGSVICQNVPMIVMENVRDAVPGEHFLAIITMENILLGTGENGSGQLANGKYNDISDYNTPATYEAVPVEIMTNVAQVACGFYHMIILKYDSSIWTVGNNLCGQLGFGRRNGSDQNNIFEKMVPLIVTTPTKIMDGGASVAAGGYMSGVVKIDGSLWTWGENENGQLATGYKGQKEFEMTTFSTPTKVAENVSGVAFGIKHMLVMTLDGTLMGSGGNVFCELIKGNNNIDQGNYRKFQTYLTKLMDNIKIPTGALRGATPNNSIVQFDAKSKNIGMYTIENEYGGGTSLVKLRDIAYMLMNTESQFSVSFDSATQNISITKGELYVPVGGELETVKGNSIAVPSTSKVYVDGQEVQLKAYKVGMNTYFELRDLGNVLGFGVDWDSKTKTIAVQSRV